MNVNQLNRGITIGFLVILYKNRTVLRKTAEITSILQFINYFKKISQQYSTCYQLLTNSVSTEFSTPES